MKLLRYIALLTLISVGFFNSTIMAAKPTVNEHQRNLAQRAAAKLKNNGALQHLIKKAAAKKAQTKARQEKCCTDLERKKMVYGILFACLICNIPSILAQSLLADKISDSKEISPLTQISLQSAKQPSVASFRPTLKSESYASTWQKMSEALHTFRREFLIDAIQDITCKEVTSYSTVVRHERHDGFIQKCVIDTEGAHCSLVNPEETVVVAQRSFKLDFNRTCELPPTPRETLGETKMRQELLDAADSGQLNIGPDTTPYTYNALQELLSHIDIDLKKVRLELDYNNAHWSPSKHEIVLGIDDIKNDEKNDHELIFTLGHEMGHGTQYFGFAKYGDRHKYKAAYKTLAADITSRINSIENYISLGEFTIATIVPAALMFLLQNKLRSVKSRVFFYFACAAILAGSLEFIKSQIEFDFKNQIPTLIDHVKFNHPSCRHINSEIHADLVSLATSENQYKYSFDDHLKLTPVEDAHPAHRFRCAYIQEFIEKYQKLLDGFNADQQAIEDLSPQRVIKTMLFGLCVMFMLFDTLR